jgi:hypothetical protein
MKVPLVPVQIGNGVVVLHTWEEWLRLIRGVDLEAAQAATAEIPEPEENP